MLQAGDAGAPSWVQDVFDSAEPDGPDPTPAPTPSAPPDPVTDTPTDPIPSPLPHCRALFQNLGPVPLRTQVSQIPTPDPTPDP